MVRVVLDTHVLVSAILNRGKARNLILELLERHSLITSTQMLAEFSDVMAREKFNAIKESRIESFKLLIIRGSVLVEPDQIMAVITEDPEDNLILSVACSRSAEYIVTGDRHLLELSEFREIRIMRISKMLEIIR